MPLPAATATGLGSASTSVPQEFFYTGVMDIRGYTLTDLADVTPGAVRLRSEEANNLGNASASGDPNHVTTIPRSLDILDSGALLIPCIETDGWSSKTAFTSYLADWIDALDAHADEPPLWWEIGNEPNTTATGKVLNDSSSSADKALARDKYLDYMTDASTILDARGKKLMMTHCIGATGGYTAMLTDINGGSQSSSFSMIDGLAVHPYAWEVVTGSGSPYTNVHDVLAGYRTLFDSYNGSPGLQHKPIWVTEVGFSCAVRADGTGNPGDWNPAGQSGNVPSMTTGTNVGQKPKTITLAQQASYLTAVFNDLRDSRAKSSLYIRAAIWFGYHDYGIANKQWDRHCGVLDINDGKRPSYNSLKNYQRSFAIGT